MALNSDSTDIQAKKLAIKVEGQLDDFQIVEDKSDTDDEDGTEVKSSRTVNISSTIPSSLIKPSSTSSVCGNVAVTNSENVIIGNNTYFNGPVTIKQVIQNTPGVENPGPITTEDDVLPKSIYQGTKNELAIKRFHIQKWHKITFSAICVVILGALFAILSIILSQSNQEDTSTSAVTKDDSATTSNFSKVVGFSYEHLKFIIITIVLVPLTLLLMFYTLLTWDTGYIKKCRDNDAIQDNFNVYRRHMKDDPLLIAPDHLRVVSRTDWLAQPVENKLAKIRQPVPWVIISHTATESCYSQSECVLRVRLIQMFHIESRKWDDIGYNFLVAGDGSAYYGRGWDYVGAHTLGYNRYSIGISFIGTFNNDPPPKKQLDACKKLLNRGVAIGKLANDYKLFAHRQLASTLSPGDKLYDIIKEWPHFVKNFTDISELIPHFNS